MREVSYGDDGFINLEDAAASNCFALKALLNAIKRSNVLPIYQKLFNKEMVTENELIQFINIINNNENKQADDYNVIKGVYSYITEIVRCYIEYHNQNNDNKIDIDVVFNNNQACTCACDHQVNTPKTKADYNPITSRFAWDSIRSIVDDNERKIVNEIATAIDQSVNANNVLTENHLVTQLKFLCVRNRYIYFVGKRNDDKGSDSMFLVFDTDTKKCAICDAVLATGYSTSKT